MGPTTARLIMAVVLETNLGTPQSVSINAMPTGSDAKYKLLFTRHRVLALQCVEGTHISGCNLWLVCIPALPLVWSLAPNAQRVGTEELPLTRALGKDMRRLC